MRKQHRTHALTINENCLSIKKKFFLKNQQKTKKNSKRRKNKYLGNGFILIQFIVSTFSPATAHTNTVLQPVTDRAKQSHAIEQENAAKNEREIAAFIAIVSSNRDKQAIRQKPNDE